MQAPGMIVVRWPFGSDFDFESKWRQIRPMLIAHGMTHRAIVSSSFLLFEGDRDTADALRTEIATVSSELMVEWEPAIRRDQMI